MRPLLALAAALTMLNTARAQHVDILVARDTAGLKLVTGTADLGAGEYVVGARVFGADFESVNQYVVAGEPGYNAVATPNGGLALPSSMPLGFQFKAITVGATTSNLLYWDGIGDVNFTAAPAGHTFTASRSGGLSATVDGGISDVTGFTINNTSSLGLLHRHLDFELSSITGTPDVGIYVVAQEFTMSGLQSSDPTYLVFNFGKDEMIHDSAVEYVELHLAPVPEPAGIVALAVLAGGVIRCARRRRRL